MFGWFKKQDKTASAVAANSIVDTVLNADDNDVPDDEITKKLVDLGLSKQAALEAIELVREGYEDGIAFADIEAFGGAGMQVQTMGQGNDDLFEIAVQRGRAVGGDLDAV